MTEPLKRRTLPTQRVVRRLLVRPTGRHYAYQLSRDTDLHTSVVVNILTRLTNHGWLVTWLETDTPSGRPRRRYYRLTPDGVALAAAYIDHPTAEKRGA
jgi:DNA-binding PadR family transcriptional regulator